MTSRDGPLAGLASLGEGGRRRRGRHLRSSSIGAGAVLRPLLVPGLLVVVLAAAVFVVVQAVRSAPSVRVAAVRTSFRLPGSLTGLPWPTQGAAALAVAGVGTVGQVGTTSPQPIASITKVMTALVVLEDHPLGFGQSGPSITVTPADVTQYQADVATQQSVVQVAAGETLTERQALEALLVPSGNNIADLLAVWDAGSVSAFVSKMNARAAALGLHHTHFVSPSGLDPGSRSTARDLVRLGEVAMQQPVLAQIVALPSVTLPVAGTLYNYDYEVGHDGFVGIKTGSDSQAGGCFLFDAQVPVGTRTASVIGAVLGQQTPPIIQSALNAAAGLVTALKSQLRHEVLLASGTRVGTLVTPWGAQAPVVTGRAIDGIGWPGLRLSTRARFDRLSSSVARGQRVGTLDADLGGHEVTVPLVAAQAVVGPGLGWKLTNI
jgi:D-alanyl-D-alanine carboxypeptidase (penicillin-binding protein 5/6)